MGIAVQTSCSSIGLVHDSNEFRAVQLQRGGWGERVLATAIFPRMIGGCGLELSEDELRWVGSMLARRGFVGNRLSLLPASKWCSSHILELPPVDDIKAKQQVARVEVARERKCDLNSFGIGLWDLPAKGRTRETMAVSCDRSPLDEALDQLAAVGFDPLAIDLPEQTVVRASLDQENSIGIAGYLHIGWDSSLAVIANDGVVVYIRRVAHGLGDVHTQIKEQYGLDQAALARLVQRVQDEQLEDHERPVGAMWTMMTRSLVEELDVAVRYVSHAYRMAELGSICLSGYGATHSGLIEQVDTLLGMPVSPLVPETLKISGISSAQCALLAMPYGLAVRNDRP
ncbi:MAG: pilus assembly protein PilM [Phycisphaerales bacterium]|nr:pilus assembly protein PilM [Phycisphaerales bacterium]